jgi:ferric-dicitrate binding protein FerR (iron transport regulator)
VRLAGRIPVEPLDEERLINIERRVVAGAVDAAVRRPDISAPRRHAAWAFAAVALVGAGAIGWMLRPAPHAPVVAAPAPVRVETAAQRTMLDLGDARIESDPATAFEVTRPDGGVVITLARGKVELEVQKRGARPPLVVRAGETSVVVVGTHFTVDYGDGRGEVDVQVREGAVRVVHQRQETRVAAGQAWRTRSGLVAAAEPAAAPPSGPGA